MHKKGFKMKKILQKLNHFIPLYVVLPVICIFILQSTIYFGTKLLNANLYKYDLTLPIDHWIPIIPWFSYIYVGCYLWWALNYLLAGRPGKEHFYRFMANILLGYVICGIIFVIFPTVIERPTLTSVSTIGEKIMNYVYLTDTPCNLFPSMHCLISWYCYIGIRKQSSIPFWYRIFSLIMAILVCISTVTIKQHFFVDIIAGIFIAELTYFISARTNLYKPFMSLFETINGCINRMLRLSL